MRWPHALATALLVATSGTARPAPAQDALLVKADAFRSALHARHLSDEGLVLYRVNLRTIARELETGAYPDLADTPTFNGILAGAACAHAAHTSGTERSNALVDAERALAGLELLMKVTSRPGLLARAARRGGPAPGNPARWHRGEGELAAYWWRDDVSLDQYANGLLPAAALCREEFRPQSRRLVVAVAEHLLAHEMQLIDFDGERTRFGDLSWRSGLGFNSIAQLTAYGVFALAAELDDDPRWAVQRERLRNVYRVVARSRVTNLRILGITNSSNDLMAFSLFRALLPLARQTEDPAYADLRHGLYLAWLRTRDDRNPYFTAIFCQLEPARCDDSLLATIRSELEAFPNEKRQLPPGPELRDWPRQLLPGRKLRVMASVRVPIELRPPSSFEWKSSPYRLARHGDPELEFTGLDFLVAYWLYRDVLADRASLVP